MAVSAVGNIYVAQAASRRIQKYDTDGNLLLQWGVGGTGDGEFSNLAAIEVFGSFLYVIDDRSSLEDGSDRVQKFTLDGSYVTQWDLNESAVFVEPTDIAIDSNENIYIADSFDGRILKFDSDGNPITAWRFQGETENRYYRIAGLAIDSSNNIYATDTSNYRIQKFDSDGNFLAQWQPPFSRDIRPGLFADPFSNDLGGIAVDANGNIFVGDAGYKGVVMFDSSLNYIDYWTGNELDGTQIRSATDLELGPDGSIYLLDGEIERVQKYALTDRNTSINDVPGGYSQTFSDLDNGRYTLSATPPINWVQEGIRCDNGASTTVEDGLVVVNLNGEDITCTFTNQRLSQVTVNVQPSQDAEASFDFAFGKPPADSHKSIGMWDVFGNESNVFEEIFDIAIGRNGTLYTVESAGPIRTFDTDGNSLGNWRFDTSSGRFYESHSIAVGSTDRIYVFDRLEAQLWKFEASGNFRNRWRLTDPENGIFNSSSKLAANSSDEVYFADRTNHRILKFDSAGGFLASWGTLGTSDGEFDSPSDLALDASNNLYVVDKNNHRIQKFDENGTFLAAWGTLGDGEGAFESPHGIAVDYRGNVFVTEPSKNRIQKFDSDGTFLLQWGSEGGGEGEFRRPGDMVIDRNNNLYVVEKSNYRVQKFAPTEYEPTLLTIAPAQQPQSISDLRPGRHTLTQAIPDGWTLEDITCDNGVTTTRLDDGIAIELTGVDTTCTFTNAPIPVIEPTPEPTPTPAPTTEPTPTAIPTTPPTVCGPLIQEAEAGILSGQWSVGNDDNASGGRYIFTPDNDEQVTRTSLQEEDINRHKASYCFTVAEPGTYRVLGWVYAEDERDNSLLITVDGQPAAGSIWDLPLNTRYDANYANSRADAGDHVVDIYRREDGARLDKIALVLLDGSEPVLPPPPPANCQPLGQEGENGVLYGNFAVGDDASASGGKYVYVPDTDVGAASLHGIMALNPRHRADYCISVSEAGDYRIRTQVQGPDNRGNSFFVQVDGAPEAGTLYDIFPVNNSYVTDYVSQRGGADPVIYSLTPGDHTISFILREDGARLDSFTLEPVSVEAQSVALPSAVELRENLVAEGLLEEDGGLKIFIPAFK